MALTPSLRKLALDSLHSKECPHCGKKKESMQSFCRRCYFALPGRLRADLYKSMGYGYEEAWDEAKTYLQAETDIPKGV